jgi:hypothetical protein
MLRLRWRAGPPSADRAAALLARQQADRATDTELRLRQHQQRRAGWLEAHAYLGPAYRQVVRDLARHRTCSAAAVVAVTAGLAVPMLLGVQAATSAASQRAYAPRELRVDQVLVDAPAAPADVTKLLPGARQAPFTTANEAGGGEITVHGPAIDYEYNGVNQGLAIGDQELLVAMGGQPAAAAFAAGPWSPSAPTWSQTARSPWPSPTAQDRRAASGCRRSRSPPAPTRGRRCRRLSSAARPPNALACPA